MLCEDRLMQSEDPRYWEDYEVGRKYPLGSTSFTAEEIVEFAEKFDPAKTSTSMPKPAKSSLFGGLCASGWHVAAKLMRLFVDNYVDKRTGAGLSRPRRAALAEAGPAGRHAHRLGRVCEQGPVQEPPRTWVSSTSIGRRWNQNGELVMTTKGVNMVRRRPA